MVQVTWAGSALRDMREIREFIGRDSQQYARAMVETIRARASYLAAFPRLGRAVPEFPASMYRELLVRPYRVIYLYFEDRSQVLVVSVIHGGRLLRSIPEHP